MPDPSVTASQREEVAASFLSFAADCRLARIVIALPRSEGWLETTAEHLGIPPLMRKETIDQACAAADRAIEQASRLGLRVVTTRDALYPPLLLEIADPPIVLWVRGQSEVLSRTAVAVVGARAASPAGIAAARQLGEELAAAGLLVVSGLARGVDGAAHSGALEAGDTLAVLGCGADLTYPREHEALAARIAERGAVISEFAPGTPPLAHHFPLRNRIISGVSRAVVVIEASDKSGSLITARAALDQNRDVLAVPGNIASGSYRGSHALIKDGARLVDTVQDVLDEIGWTRPIGASGTIGAKPQEISELEASMPRAEACSVDELAARTGRPAPDLLAELSVLELAGRVTRSPAGGFIRS